MSNPLADAPKRRSTYVPPTGHPYEPDWAQNARDDEARRVSGQPDLDEFERHMAAMDRLRDSIDDDDRSKYGSGFSA